MRALINGQRSIPACAGEPATSLRLIRPPSVYPRVCGGTYSILHKRGHRRGLSPRVRGNPVGGAGGNGQMRSIPACAGEPELAARRYLRLGVYPACAGEPVVHGGVNVVGQVYPACAGEPVRAYILCCDAESDGLSPRVRGNLYVPPNRHRVNWGMGLSPRVRGNRQIAAVHGKVRRSIPACAGEPIDGYTVKEIARVYPRVCGGTRIRDLDAGGNVLQGLSPRVRGNLYATRVECHRRRSIPACAGEPGRRLCSISRLRVYPRVCGGTGRTDVDTEMKEGLSPRVRGNHTLLLAVWLAGGSIPACAGEPLFHNRLERMVRVYPRVCGGTPVVDSDGKPDWGLSPRVRGNQAEKGYFARFARSIPACAGEPDCSILWESNNEVYPRVCGGTNVEVLAENQNKGLSPRVRGNRYPRWRHRDRNGSIPACAGEPLSDLYLFSPLLRSYRLIVLHQVDPVSIDYLLRLLSQYLNSLAAYRRRLPPGHHYRSLLHLGIPPSQYFPDPPPYAACHVWRRVYAGRYLQHGRGKKTSITRRDIDRNNDCHLLPPSSRRARRLATLR